MKKIVFIVLSSLLLITLSAENSSAQFIVHLSPANGANGIPGPTSGSYIMIWSSMPNAVAYQWINSNNHLCFYGCAGDTRDGTTVDTNTIIYNIPNNEWRYWIVRAILSNGDTTSSTGIFSFLPKGGGTIASLFSIAPNPAKDNIAITIDWFSNPKINKVTYSVMNTQGQILAFNKSFELKRETFVRNEKHTLELPQLNPGIYFIIITTDEDYKEYIEKVIIQ